MAKDVNQPDPPFTLTSSDRQSGLWQKLEAHFNDRLTTRRKQNDNDATEAQTANCRGRIAELKSILELGKEPRIID